MAAVFALVFLFVIASVGMMVKISGGSLDFGTTMATVSFVTIAFGVFFGLFKMARRWEEEEPTGE